MGNPALLLCDSDVLVQFFLVDELRPLEELKKSFGVQATIVLEVDLELRWIPKHRARFVSQLDRAIRHGIIARLDQRVFQSHLSAAPPGTSWGTFQSLGAQYYGYVQRGEAYTFAAAVTLGMPAASNDFRAIQLLQVQMLSLPAPVLRSFDLLVFAYERGVLTLKECETIRSELLKHGEGFPKAFANKSFEDGLKRFNRRLSEAAAPATSAASTPRYSDPLYIVRI